MKRLILLLVATSVVILATPCFAQSNYTWALSCSGAAANGSAGTGVSWVWLNNGQQITLNTPPNGFASCLTGLNGIGEVPTTINGIEVNGIAVTMDVSESPSGCQAFASVTKSFDPTNPKISIRASATVPAKVKFFGVTEDCPKASVHFSITTGK